MKHNESIDDISGTRPNFILILTDDQDLLFESMSYMPFTANYFKQNGITFTNSFISTPICCPSRVEEITGRSYHNIRQKGYIDCMGTAAVYNIFNNKHSMFQMFTRNNYYTSSFGKLTNNMHEFWCNTNKILTNGFDRIYCPCNFNNYYGERYMNYWMDGNISIRMNKLNENLYQTSKIGNMSLRWIRNVIRGIKKGRLENKPFLTWIGVHAPHYPATPANWYSNLYSNLTAPRTPNFNLHVDNHYDFISTNPEFDENVINNIDQTWRNRLRSLLSVDDLIKSIINLLTKENIINNTYILFSSDHGYHLGQFRIPCSKQLIYETDIRIPTFLSGPNIISNSYINNIVSNIDFLPTILDLASIKYDENIYDGMSWIKGLNVTNNNNNNSIKKWRDKLLIQYESRSTLDFKHCGVWWPTNKSFNSFKGEIIKPKSNNVENKRWLINSKKNIWRALRIINDSINAIYSEYVDDFDNKAQLENPAFFEYYDINKDPYQINNIYNDLDIKTKNQFHKMLVKYAKCNGMSCW